MTVKELITHLRAENQNAEVVLGYGAEAFWGSPLHDTETCWFEPYKRNPDQGRLQELDDPGRRDDYGREVLCLKPRQ